MSMNLKHGARIAGCVIAIGTAAGHACTSTAPDVFSVGNKAVDSSCNYGSIQDAINAATCPAGTRIVLNQSGDYTNQHLSITNKNITLVGRANTTLCNSLQAQCGTTFPCPTNPLRTIDGGSGGASSTGVITIRGASNVTLQYLTISGGNHGGDGGGIDYSGAGTLTLNTSTVANNTADYGAGINFKGSGGDAELHLDSRTVMLLNTANVSGGGVRIEGTARLIMLGADSTIGGNTAKNGYGGGIEILGPARADLSGYGGYIPVAGNTATWGGGVAAINNGNGEPVLRTFASGPDKAAMQISNNAATSGGGAVYLQGAADACLFATQVNGNSAPNGAALDKEGYAGQANEQDSGFFINGGSPARLGTECGPESIADLGGSNDCAPNTTCSTINGNTADDGSGGTDGAVIYDGDSHVAGTRFRLQNNSGAYAIRTGGASVTLKRCLITDNTASGVLLAIDYAFGGTGSPESIDECTIAHNTIQGAYVFEFLESGTVGMSHDIINAPGIRSVHFTPSAGAPGATLNAGYILASDTTGLPAASNPSIVAGNPSFVDAAHGDYHLAAFAQAALDFAPNTFLDFDLDGQPSGIDLPAIPNTYGTTDLGAYERQNLFYNCGNDFDTVFCDGFEH
jgi:hypothetical protein